MASKQTFETILREIDAVMRRIRADEADELCHLVRTSQSVFVTGEGRSGLIARCFAMRLMHLGLSAHVVGGTTTPACRKGDLLVAISGSGRTELTLAVAELATEANVRVAVVTSHRDSPLASRADLVLGIPAAREELDSKQYGRSLFEQCALLALDGIAAELQSQLNLSGGDMSARHANLE
ncbi:MAG: SIS domain-containing protein [Armatimonadetes bacterium]|nr:SIS domain-containing protein [Armatimonadota bacterium]